MGRQRPASSQSSSSLQARWPRTGRCSREQGSKAPYAGSWHGTIHLGNSPQAEADRHIFVEFGENGSFNCPTHDLVTLKEGAPSAGWLSWNAEGVEFITNTAEGEERHAFQFFHVPREERNELAPPKLYLHDVANDIHLHLTPVSLTSPAR